MIDLKRCDYVCEGSIPFSGITSLCYLPFERQIIITSTENENDIVFGYSLSLDMAWSLKSAYLEMVAIDRKLRSTENKSDAQQQTAKDLSFCNFLFNLFKANRL